MHRKHFQAFIPCMALIGVFLVAITSQAQPAKDANKFLGNITTNGQVRTDFLNYWNQITGENESKWQSVEGSRDVMSWAGTDRVANYAKQQGIPWKFHTLIWGSQFPDWITNLSQSDQLAEITEWMDAAAAKYPDVPMIDVVNEAYSTHAPAPFKNALGGDGSTGFDWIIKSFQMARDRWPNAILIYNDYNNCEYGGEVNWTVQLINAMKAANAPIDAIGCQAHDAFKIATSTVKSNIDKLAATGYPIFITEYDIGEANDDRQKTIMQEQFTMFWNHPKIVGITYWGYLVGSTWRDGTGLMNSNGTERPALTWLKEYVTNNPNPPNDFPDLLNGGNSNYRLSVSTKGQGTVDRSPNESSYPASTPVTLTATPSEGWIFDSWSGGASGNQNPLTITMESATAITANFTTEDGKQDLILNGNFSSGEDSWIFNIWGGDGTGSVVDEEYSFAVNTIGENSYDIQVVQAGIRLEKDKTYRLIYDARASANRALNVNIGMPEDPYTTFLSDVIEGETEVNLTTSKQSFTLDFVMEEETYDDSRVEFCVGLNTSAVFIDNVSLFEIEGTAVSAPVQKMRSKQMSVRQKGALVNITFNTTGNSSAFLNVYDLNGNVVRSARFNDGFTQNCSFNTAGMSKGYYVVKVRSGNSVQKSGLILTGR